MDKLGDTAISEEVTTEEEKFEARFFLYGHMNLYIETI